MSEVFNQSVLDAINRAVQDGISTTALEVDGTPQYCIINAETREIEIPGELNVFGVESDEKSTRVYFRCPKHVGTNVDLDMTKCMVYVPYRNANGEKDQYIVTDLNETEDGENVEFTWLISRKASAYMGITEFGIRAIKTAVGGTIEAEWNTTVASANVIRGMDVGLLEFSEENKDALAQALDLINQELKQTKDEMNSAIELKGQQTLATIPDDYTTAAQNALSAKNEVEDIRVGADNKTYSSAGEAVREQIGLLFEDIGQIVNKRTYQLYDKKNKYGNLYRQRDGEIITNAQSISFTFLIENNTRKVFRIDNIANLVGKITGMGAFASADYPEPGIQSIIAGSAKDDSSIYGAFRELSNQKYGTIYLLFPDSSEEEIQEYAKDISNKLVVGDVTNGYELEYENYRILNVEEKNLPDNFRQSIMDEAKNYTVEYSKNNYWKDKTIIWFGTSIPEGKDTAIGSSGSEKSYPEMVGDLLGASVINMSLGSSMARANTRTGDYEDGYSYNIVRALTATIEEKQDMITNWETYRQRLRDPDTYESLESMEDTIINSSFEKRLLPYLDGTYNMPDLFVIDHGHNDHKYKLQDGATDILLNPTLDNIENGTLSVDTFMTKNSNKNMINFFGDLSKIPNINSFIASINRNCFKGAINFICTLILKHNPRARIMFISNLDNWQRTDLTTAQKEISESWSFPIIEVWKYLGFGVHYIPGTSNFWGNSNSLDLTQKQIYCKDGTHPHSDTTGKSMEMYANIIANGLKNAL